MFGVGYQEMLLIGLAALLLFGPGKLPEVMSQAGKWYKQFRDVTSELTGEFNKTVAEAKGELDSLGIDLGPMQQQVNSISKSVQKDLGGSGAKKTTSTGKKTTTSTTSKAKTGTASKSSSSSTSSTSKTSATKSSSATASGARTNTTTKPSLTTKPVVVASKEDPVADLSVFEPEERKPRRRARAATPSAFTDLTPRDISEPEELVTVAAAPSTPEPIAFDADDPIARARQRRLKAGYTQASA